MYEMMSNGEVDYPSWEAALDHTAGGWLPPNEDPAIAADLSNGNRSFFLISVGPFDLPRDSSVTIAIALTGGLDFHTNPQNFRTNFDPMHPGAYRSQLSLDDLLRKVQWARWTYDNPGVDTDHDGYAGEWILRGRETLYVEGDGVPDIRAAVPPRAPSVRAFTRKGQITLQWNGWQTETALDLFVQRVDFEGYRIYMSRSGNEDDWAFLSQRDLPNYAQHTWNAIMQRWEMIDPPFSLDSLIALYGALSDSSYGFPFHPDSFAVPLLARALLEVRINERDPSELDSIYRYFTGYEANNVPDDQQLLRATESGLAVNGVIRKLYPMASPVDTAYRDDGAAFLPYYEYEYAIDGLQLAEPVFLAVTAFDHGDPAGGLEPLESPKAINSQEVWPINSADVVKAERPAPGVYPNPYRLIDDYYGRSWENRRGLEPDQERARQVTFYNVPDTCTVSIWSLDGDLVRKIKHYADPSSSEATVVRWDLITRNTQAVKTGIYVWSIESRFGTDVGKLVIIK